jgi:ABC-type proline/glycine betaine transport system ATPase subunit
MVFDYAGQLTQLKVLDEITTPLQNRGVPGSEADERARQLLTSVGLGGRAGGQVGLGALRWRTAAAGHRRDVSS